MIRNISVAKHYIFSIPFACNVVNKVTFLQLGKRFTNHHNVFSSFVARNETPTTMKIDSPEFRSIFTTELKVLAKLFEDYGYELRIVGGAVRDLLNKKEPHDLDFATTATPQQMKEMFEKEEVRMLNNRGEKHGTITPRINDKQHFEVTTLRTDVRTDGRHAEVEFTTSWALDAERRDLTINSMYLGLDGTVYDYFGGYEDLMKKRVVFVGDANKRIQEDYLRILRYFRFYGRIAEGPNLHDEDTLKAIEQNASGLERISGERIWSELQRILIGNFAEELMKKMLDLGLAPYIGLGSVEELDIVSFEKVHKLRQEQNYTFKAITYIAALLPNEDKVNFEIIPREKRLDPNEPESVFDFHFRVKLSSHERVLATFIVTYKSVEDFNDLPPNPLRYFQEALITTKLNRMQVREHIMELFRFRNETELLASFEAWQMPNLPVNGNMLKEKGIQNGGKIGFILNRMRELWIASDFKLTENDLLEKLPEIQADMERRKKLKVST